MTIRNVQTWVITLLFAALTASCSSSTPARPKLTLGPAETNVTMPGYFGLYAITANGLVRLNGNKPWEVRTWNDRNNLEQNTRFLIYSRWLNMDARPEDKTVVLQRVAHLRSTRATDGTVERAHDAWVSSNLPQYRIPLQFAPVPGHSDMLIAAPAGRLPPGLYSLSFKAPESWSSRFGVAWPNVARGPYDSEYCVDKLPQGFTPCGNRSVAAAATPLVIRDLHSSRRTGDGGPRLVIDGNVVNTSEAEALVPPFSVVLLGANHQVLQSLQNVSVDIPSLRPGGSYHFQIVVTNAAVGATQVRVTPSA